MKKHLIFIGLFFFLFAASASAEVNEAVVTALDGDKFIIVHSIDGGNIVELFEIKNGKVQILDSYRYTRKSEIGGGYSIEFERVQRIREK